MPKCAPNYLSAIRSPENSSRACQIGRHFQHQDGLHNLHKGRPGVGVGRVTESHRTAESKTLHYGDATQPLIRRGHEEQGPTEMEENSFLD